MRILHTADWHLGKRLGQYERTEEHVLFLQWLLKSIDEQKIDALIIAGDVFDTGNPSNSTLKQYYDFLWQVKNTCCQDVFVIGGNHDSVATLDAPRELLSFFNIHVVGGVSNNVEEQIIPLKNKSGDIQLVVCAVPFLRDKDIRLSIPGETIAEREQRIKQGILEYYQRFVPYVEPYKKNGVAVLATGHLFAVGSQASPDSEKDIHVGNLGQVAGNQFPCEFDYIALGHMHRPQVVGRMSHIRYSGSPVPLSFSENEDSKSILIAEFENAKLVGIEEFPVPIVRRLIRVKGNLAKVKSNLLLIEPRVDELPVWVEVQVETDDYIYDLEEQLRNLDIPHVELVFIKQLRNRVYQNISEHPEVILSLSDLNPLTVFEKKCEADYFSVGYDDLIQTFKETLELMKEADKEPPKQNGKN